jgi:hypothetical protein
MAITHMLARLTATTVRTTSQGASLSVPARGFTAFTEIVDSTVAVTTVVVTMDVAMDVISKDAVLTDDLASKAADGASTDAVATSAAFEGTAGTASAATVVSEAAPTVSMTVDIPEVALAVSMAARATTAAVLTEEDTGNFSELSTENWNGWQHPLPAVFIFSGLESWNSLS